MAVLRTEDSTRPTAIVSTRLMAAKRASRLVFRNRRRRLMDHRSDVALHLLNGAPAFPPEGGGPADTGTAAGTAVAHDVSRITVCTDTQTDRSETVPSRLPTA